MTALISDEEFDRLHHLEDENARLREVIRVHDLCHDLHGKVGATEFAEGCRREQIKQFGFCPTDQRIKELEEAIEAMDMYVTGAGRWNNKKYERWKEITGRDDHSLWDVQQFLKLVIAGNSNARKSLDSASL